MAGVVNAGIDVYRGNYGNAGLNLLSAVPLLGTVMKGTKLAVVGVKAMSSISKAKVIKSALAITYRNMKTIAGMHKHHIIPGKLLFGTDDLGKAIRASGFDGNAGEYIRYLEKGFHGNHPAYTDIVADKLQSILKERGSLTIQDINGVVNDMHNIIDKAQDAFKSTGNNLNEFSKQLLK